MIRNSKNLIRSYQLLKLHNHPIIFKSMRSFGQLPKPSRFSQQIGLQKQFEKLQDRCEKQEKSSARTYEFIIWVFVCLIGSLAGSLIVMPSFRSKMGLVYELFILSTGNRSRCKHSLQKVLQHQTNFYQNRIYFDTIIAKIVKKCISLQQPHSSTPEKYHELIMKILKNNIHNRENTIDSYSIYHRYFVEVYEKNGSKCDESQEMKHIVKNLLEFGDLKIIYLIVFLNNKILKMSESDKEVCLRRVGEFRKQVRQNEQKIKQMKQMDSNLLLEPYEFECQMRSKWMGYIQKNI